MADPWSFLDRYKSPEEKPDPWGFLDRAGSTSRQQVKISAPFSEWQATASPNLQRRKLPDGRWEYRPTPQEGREPAVTPAESPLAGLMGPYGSPAPAVEALGGQAVARAKQGLAALGMDLPGMLVQGLANAPAQLHNALTQPLRQSGDPVLERAYPEMPLAGPLPGDPVVEQRERIREEYERRRHGTAELFRDAPVAGAIADAGADLTFDLTNAIPGGAAGKTLARRAASELGQRALELAAVRKIPLLEAEKIVAAEMKAASRSLAEGAEYTAEELADLAARKRGLARLRPEDIEPTMPAAPPPRRLGAGIPDAEIEQRLGMRTTREEGEELARVALPLGEPGHVLPDAPDPWAFLGPAREPEAAPLVRPTSSATPARERRLYRGQTQPWNPEGLMSDLVYFWHSGADEDAAFEAAYGFQWRSPEGVTIRARPGELKIVSAKAHPDFVKGAIDEGQGEGAAQSLRNLGADAFIIREQGRPVLAVRRDSLSKLQDVEQLAADADVDDWQPLRLLEEPEPTSPSSLPEIEAPVDAGSPFSIDEAFPPAAREVDGRLVRDEIPNYGSIESSLDSPEELPGVRVLRMEDFDPEYRPNPYSKNEVERLRDLTAQIGHSREISPLIVVVDDEPYPYILEGGHRFDALRNLGAQAFPAKVVIDADKTTMEDVVSRLAGRRRSLESPPPFSPSPEVAKPETTFRMSTKGIENITGLQPDLRAVIEANRPDIAAARGPVVPVSRWHDAEGLAERLKLTPEDYLAMPPGRTLSTEEHSLGRHFLGGMKQEAKALEARIAAGRVDDMAAALAEKSTRNRDVVRMMATLQAQGSSEYGRGMRALQEALDPYGLAETPREKVQLSLLKKYKAANAEEASRIEAAAVARLKRQAARETRKAGRQATVGELDAELGNLVQEFRSAARRPRAFSTVVPLDPELVAVVGKMAANRVRAGVVAVEELADQVYTAVAQHLDGITREQVKAAIVEHASTRPAKMAPEEARLRRAEAAAGRAVKKLEERIAGGGSNPPASSPWSAKLGELKARQAELREQLASMQSGQNARMPASEQAGRLRARETALARQVQQAEERLAAGPQVPKPGAPPPDSPRLQDLRQRLDEVRAEIAADPRQGLAARYRELLDDQTVEMIAALPDPVEDPDALLDFLRKMERPTFRDYMGAYVYNNLLSGPKSLLKNVVGNTVKRWDRITMQPLAAGFERVLAPRQGRLPERYAREVLPMVVGSCAGAPEALKKGLWVLKNGWDPERVIAELTGMKGNAKYYEGRLPVDPFLLSENKAVRVAGAVHGYGPRLMQVGDVMARTRNFSSASYAWATRQAINDVKQGLASDVAERAAHLLKEQPDEMIEYARRIAREDTFQDEVSNVAKLLGAGRREDTGVGFALNQTVRFLNVPDRIMSWFADYTPGLRLLGAAWPEGKLRKVWGTPEASDLLARQTFGTALAAAAAAWAFQGKLTGNMPRDEKLKNDAFEAGKQPNSVLVGGRWVPIRDVFGGWAGPVVAAAAFHDSAMTGEPVDGEEVLRRAGGAALGEARFLLDAGYLSTLSDTVGAIQAEPAQAGREMAGLVTRTAAGALIPWSGAQRNVAIFQDPRVVDHRQSPLDEVKAGIPGLRQTLPARVGNLGEELRQNTGAAGGFLPIVPTKNRVADPGLAEEVERLRATVAERRREIGRVEQQVKEARRAQDLPRVRELRAGLRGNNTNKLDAVMETIRTQEMRIRKLRASGKPEDVIRRTEVEIQRRMVARLERALAGLR